MYRVYLILNRKQRSLVNTDALMSFGTWTELVGNPSMFSVPSIAAAGTTPTTKTSFVVSITPSASSLDSFTQQQINQLTNSKAIKYTITSTDAKVLTPPTGTSAFREVSYDAVKNNNIPLK